MTVCLRRLQAHESHFDVLPADGAWRSHPATASLVTSEEENKQRSKDGAHLVQLRWVSLYHVIVPV